MKICASHRRVKEIQKKIIHERGLGKVLIKKKNVFPSSSSKQFFFFLDNKNI